MINGLTAQGGVIVLSEKPEFKGKISTGFAPGEGGNNTNFPKAAGFFRILKKTVRKERLKNSQKVIDKTVWVENTEVQEAIDLKKDKEPRLIKCVSFVAEPDQMWSSRLIMFNARNEMVCSSCGEGCVADFYQQQGDSRVRIDRECLYQNCPDYQSGSCKENGMLIVWPEADMDPLTPYKFTTTSKNTIVAIETMLHKLYQQMKIAHIVSMHKNPDTPQIFMGLNGLEFFLKHEQINSGGRTVWVTKLIPSKTTQMMIRDANQAIISDGGQRMLSQVMAQSKHLVYDAEFSAVPMIDMNMEMSSVDDLGVTIPTSDTDIEEDVVMDEPTQKRVAPDASAILDE